MAKENAKQPEVKAEAPKKERKVLTPAERIAKLEAELAAARDKAAAKERKQIDVLLEKRTKLTERVRKLDDERIAITKQLIQLGHVDASTEQLTSVDEAQAS